MKISTRVYEDITYSRIQIGTKQTILISEKIKHKNPEPTQKLSTNKTINERKQKSQRISMNNYFTHGMYHQVTVPLISNPYDLTEL